MEEEEEDTARRSVSIKIRLKRKRPESEKARWETIRRNAWLRELLTSSSEEEEKPEEKRARTDKEGCLRFEESSRLLAEADPAGHGEMAKLQHSPPPPKKENPERLRG
jgi:hypothetical protein